MRTALTLLLTLVIGPANGLGAPPDIKLVDAPPLQQTWTILPTWACGNVFVAIVSLNGSGPWPMLLDTGTPVTVITEHVAARIGAEDRIDTLRIGSFRVKGDIPCTIRELDVISHALGADIQGIVGYEVFRDVLITYDYPRQEVRLRAGELPARGADIVPMASGPEPIVSAAIDGRNVPVLIDTGAVSGLQLAGLDDFALAAIPRPVRGSIRLDGLRIVSMARLVGDVSVGSCTLETPVVAEAAGPSLLGVHVLKHFAVTLDQANGRAQFQRPTDDPDAAAIESPPLYGIGAALHPAPNHLIAVRVFEGSPAERAGLREGDSILAIDGVVVDSLRCAHGKGMSDGPGRLRLTIERDGETAEIVITLEPLVP